jgi:hypothetical protein
LPEPVASEAADTMEKTRSLLNSYKCGASLLWNARGHIYQSFFQPRHVPILVRKMAPEYRCYYVHQSFDVLGQVRKSQWASGLVEARQEDAAKFPDNRAPEPPFWACMVSDLPGVCCVEVRRCSLEVHNLDPTAHAWEEIEREIFRAFRACQQPISLEQLATL